MGANVAMSTNDQDIIDYFGDCLLFKFGSLRYDLNSTFQLALITNTKIKSNLNKPKHLYLRTLSLRGGN